MKYCHVPGCGGKAVTGGEENLCDWHYQRKFVEQLPVWDQKRLGEYDVPDFANWEAFLKDWRENHVPALIA